MKLFSVLQQILCTFLKVKKSYSVCLYSSQFQYGLLSQYLIYHIKQMQSSSRQQDGENSIFNSNLVPCQYQFENIFDPSCLFQGQESNRQIHEVIKQAKYQTSDGKINCNSKENSQISISIQKIGAKRKICYSKLIQSDYKLALIGCRKETMGLNVNLKTLIYNYFKQKLWLKQIQMSNSQLLLLKQFKKNSPSFASFKLLFFTEQGDKTSFCYAFQILANSSEFIHMIFKSDADLKNKIAMVKYLRVLIFNINNKGKMTKWKQLDTYCLPQKG